MKGSNGCSVLNVWRHHQLIIMLKSRAMAGGGRSSKPRSLWHVLRQKWPAARRPPDADPRKWWAKLRRSAKRRHSAEVASARHQHPQQTSLCLTAMGATLSHLISWCARLDSLLRKCQKDANNYQDVASKSFRAKNFYSKMAVLWKKHRSKSN